MNRTHSATRLAAARGKIHAALLLAALAAPAALADARADAKRHFREGMSLISAGQIEKGIAELKQAYAIKPHPDVLYDIGKAYVDLGNIPEALNYFRQYVATDPADKEQVLAVMQRLEAAMGPPAPQPAPAPTAAQGTELQRLVAQLQTLIDQQTQSGGGVPQAAKPSVAKKPEAKAANPEDEMFEAETISARTRATAQEITADEIRMTGAVTLPEILRRVPGIDVAEMDPSDTNISFRGFNRRVANKVLVLVDGRSVYQDFLGGTFWPILDVAIPDIQRIEVVRGPGSALYGSNAFSGVVNIITKTGDESSGLRAFMLAGNYNTLQGGITVGGRSGKLAYRSTIAYDRADKWTRDFGDDRVDLSQQFPEPNRSREIQRADATATYDLGKTQVLAGGGWDNVAMQAVPLGALRTFGNTGQTGYLRAEVNNGPTKLRLYWNALRLTSGPEYWPDGIISIKNNIRSDVVDATAQTGVDFKAAGTHHLNFGGEYRFKSVDWGYLALRPDGSPYQENHFGLFLQDQWDISRKVTLVLSYRVDRHPLLASEDVTPGGLIHSPSGTLLYEFKPDHVLRLNLSSAFRAPTSIESYGDLFAPNPTQPALGIRFQGSIPAARTLKPEQIVTAELGYRGRFGTFQPEVVAYAERVQNLITDGALRLPANPSQAVDPVTGQYVIGKTGFENEPGSFFGLGFELSGKWSPVDGVDLSLNYSFEKMFACGVTASGECTSELNNPSAVSATLGNTAQHKLNALALWRTKANFDLGLELHYVSSVTWTERSFDVTQEGGVIFTPYGLPSYTMINGRVGYWWIREKLETGVAVYNLLGDSHREHPFGNEIGRRVLFSATGSF